MVSRIVLVIWNFIHLEGLIPDKVWCIQGTMVIDKSSLFQVVLWISQVCLDYIWSVIPLVMVAYYQSSFLKCHLHMNVYFHLQINLHMTLPFHINEIQLATAKSKNFRREGTGSCTAFFFFFFKVIMDKSLNRDCIIYKKVRGW